MMNSVLIVAPHPDDETLGCGGIITKYKTYFYRKKEYSHKISWLIVTGMKPEYGFVENQILKRQKEIDHIAEFYDFNKVFSWKFPPAGLENVNKSELIQKATEVIDQEQITDIFLPFFGDAHSDHKVVFESFFSACKSFRRSSIKRVLCYETLSETNFGIRHFGLDFVPNIYENISNTFSRKMEALDIYEGEFANHPFPRSKNSVRALAELRGSECRSQFAEAFFLVKEIVE